VKYAGTPEKSGALQTWRESVGRAVRGYFARLQMEIHNRNWLCAVRAQELMVQPRRRRQTARMTAAEAVEQRLEVLEDRTLLEDPGTEVESCV
jgi:hypothetical protein